MIEARGLVKRCRSALAVDNLSFDVRPGTVTGFLGPNGAGKPLLNRAIRRPGWASALREPTV
jgi:ABC-2 type transport system ATP-binding protein